MKVNLAQDVAPVTEFRSKAAEILDRIKETRRPLVLTQRGWPAAVLEDVNEYERRLERLELLEAIVRGLQAAETGNTVSHADAMKQLDDLVDG